MAEKKERKAYSNAYHSLEAIWTVLRHHASPEHPLSVGQICKYLEQMEQAPSRATVNRLLTQGAGLLELFSPETLAQTGEPVCTGTYTQGDALHVVLETSEGAVLQPDAALEVTARPFQAPSYSAVDKLLKDEVPFDLDTFPFRLCCMARVKRPNGRIPVSSLREVGGAAGQEKGQGGNPEQRRPVLLPGQRPHPGGMADLCRPGAGLPLHLPGADPEVSRRPGSPAPPAHPVCAQPLRLQAGQRGAVWHH